MKKLQGVIAAVLILAELGFAARAQTEFQSAALSDDLPPEPQLLEPGMAPVNGTFFMLSDFQDDSAPPPYPCNVFPNAPTYATRARGIYIVDDSEVRPGLFQAVDNVDLATLAIWGHVETLLDHIEQMRLQSSTRLSQSSQLMTTSNLDPGIPGDGEGGTNEWTPEIGYSAPVYGSNELWLQIEGVSNAVSQVYVTVHGTVADVQYEILSREALADTNGWTSERVILGQDGTTPTTISIGTRTGNLFFWCRSWQDTDGSGLPDWWQLQYFGTLGADPYGDDDGDGWNNLQEYQNGSDPKSFDTPPPPSRLSAQIDETGEKIDFSWAPSPGPVSEYVIKAGTDIYFTELGRVDSQTTSYTYDNEGLISAGLTGLWVEAVCTNGTVARSRFDFVVPTGDLWKGVYIVRGPEGRFYLQVASPAPDLAAVRLYVYLVNFGTVKTNFDIPMTAFTNGIAIVPKWMTEPNLIDSLIFARAVGTAGTTRGLAEDAVWQNWGYPQTPPQHHDFVNASAHLNQNLQFLLRAATVNNEFKFVGYSTNGYAVSKYLTSDSENFDPMRENVTWRNFLFDSTDGITNWYTGALFEEEQQYHTVAGQKYYLFGYTNPPPAAFTWDNASFFYYRDLIIPFDDPSGFSELGLTTYADGRVGMGSGVRNFYGLPVNSILILNSSNSWIIGANQTVGPLPTNQPSHFFANVAAPNLQTAGYHFTIQESFENDPVGALPSDSNFSPPVSPPYLVQAVGQPRQLTGWAKKAVANGYAGQYAYLQQYFESAYLINATGALAASSTGVLSPYGHFLPTAPGPTALVTMPDIETGQRGTGIVQVVKIQLDMNRDGVMDTSLAGADNTAQDHPFEFWANNDFDRGHEVDCAPFGGDCDFEQDDLGAVDVRKLPSAEQVPDYAFTSNGLPMIPCTRDLEDYARFWIPGLHSLMAALPAGYKVQLASDEMPLRIFRALEPDGGTNYLFDETTASNQVAQSASLYLGQLGYDAPIVLNGVTNLGEHFIFCGVLSGAVTLSLQVFDPSMNYVGGASGYLEIKDVKDMFERWTVGERPGYPPTNVAQRVTQDLPDQYLPPFAPFQYSANTDTNTPYILFVHGWNMETWEKDSYAATAYKRLYWQGYQGRFGTFRWPTDNGFGSPWESLHNPITDRQNYDRSEYNAWRSAAGLLKKLTDLNSQYPGHVYLLAHSMGNVVAGEALRLAGTNPVVNTYIASQAAVPAHTYDGSVPDYSFVQTINWGPFTPNIYTNWFLSNSGGAARRINFYNTNDYALARGLWEQNQLMKPDGGIFTWTYGFNGYPHAGYPNSATNHYTIGVDDTPPWNWFFKENFSGTDVYLDIVNVLTNRYEVMAYAAQSHSSALGRTPVIIEGAVDLGRTVNRIWPLDLQDPTPQQYSRHKWHSAQFRSTLMEQQSYWRTVLSAEGFDIQNP